MYMRVEGKLGFVRKKWRSLLTAKAKKCENLIKSFMCKHPYCADRIRRREIRSLHRGQYFAEFPNSASVDGTNFVLDNSSYYHAQPHSIIVNYPI
jgi:hypothetical protein